MLRPRCAFRKQSLNHDLTAYNRLKAAIRSKDKDLVQLLVDDGVSVNGVHEGGYKEFDPTEDLSDYNRPDNPSFTPLHLAVMSRNAEIVKILLNKGADINAYVWHGDTPLTMAAKMQNTTIVDLLLAHDSLQNSSDYLGFTHLHIACMRNNVEVVQKLLLMNQGIEINKRVYEESTYWASWTPLHFAAHFESVETVQFLHSCGANITLKNERDCSPLHLANLNRNETIIDLMLKAHETEFKNPKNSDGLSHFHIACTRDEPSVVEHFLKLGVNIDEEVESFQWEGWRPIHFAILYECHNVIKLLLRHKARLESRYFSELLEYVYFTENRSIYDLFLYDNTISDMTNEDLQKLSVLHHASIRDDVRKIEKLKCNGVINIPIDLDKPTWNGWTPLHLAVKYESQSVFKILLDLGANIEAQDNEGKTPLHLSFKFGSYNMHSGIVKYIGTSTPNLKDHEGLSLFHILCAVGHVESVQNFLQTGVNINDQVGSASAFYAGFTPLHFALNFCKPQIVDILLKHGADILLTNKLNLNSFDHVVDGLKDCHSVRLIKRDFELLIKILLHASNKHIKLNHRGLSVLHGLSTFENMELEQLEQYLTTYHDEIDRTIEFPPLLKYTPLHVATICYHRFDLAELLLKNGANPSKLNSNGNTYIEGAFLSGIPNGKSVEEVKKLFVLAASTNGAKSSHFHLACSIGLLDLVLEYPGWKRDWLNSFNDLGQTPFHSLMMLKYNRGLTEKVTNMLLENGADVNAKDIELQTPLHYAQLKMRTDITRALIDHGANVNSQNVFGQTPLHKLLEHIKKRYTGEYSTRDPFNNQVHLSLTGGSNINTKDRRGQTPLMIVPNPLENEVWEDIAVILSIHVRKLQLIGHHVNKDNVEIYNTISNTSSVQDLIEMVPERCEKELAIMENEYIDRYTTLRSVLYKNHNKMALHCENSTLQNLIQQAEFREKYPIFGFFIKLQVKNGQIRKPFLTACKKSLKIVFGTSLPEQCIDMILDHLSDKDLENIVEIK